MDLDLFGPEPPKPEPEPEPHILTVVQTDDGDIEYDLSHPGCRANQIWAYDPRTDGHLDVAAEVYRNVSFECGIGFSIDQGGFLDTIGVTSWGRQLEHVTQHLEPGEYRLKFWSKVYPSTPAGPEEYDEGVDVERIDVGDDGKIHA